MQSESKGRAMGIPGNPEKTGTGGLHPPAPETGGKQREQFARPRGGTAAPGKAFPEGAAAVLRMRALLGRILRPACFALLLPFALPPSSSGADDVAPWRSALDMERLWSGVLGCADAGDDGQAVQNALAGGYATGGARRDYLDCGTRALRATASRMLVGTIEDSLRWGGLRAFDQEFRLESDLSWELGGDFRGGLDTILPVGGVLHDNGTGRALFLQQGITFWEGRNNELRADSNTGLVYRGHVSRDWILGGSFFFDYNFQREHARLGVGADVQNDIFYGGLNYYFPPPGRKEWRRGRTGYEERALEGWDLRWSFTWERVRVGGAFGTWVFDGELDGKGSGRRRSASISAGYEIYPGVFFKAGYEYHNDRSVDEDWHLGLAFRYSLPGMEGIGGSGSGGRAPDLWRIVDREKRILYEERLARARVSATLTATPARVEEGGDVTVRVVLSEVLEEDVFFSVAAATGGTAQADDYTLPSGITVPAGALSATVAVNIADDDRSEPDEVLVLELKVSQESFFLVSRGNPHRARVVIGASDNSRVGFATESTPVTEGIDVDIPLALGEPAPAGGFVLLVTSSDDKEEDVTTDASMRIVEGAQDGQYIRVSVIDDHVPEGTEMVRITLAEPREGLPEGWRINRREHVLMIQPHDLDIAFELSSSEVGEDAGIVNLALVLNGPAPAGLVLNISSDLGEDAVPVHSTLTVPEGARRVNLPVEIIDDKLDEGDEVATIRIFDAGADSMPKGWNVGPQSAHRLTIKDNDFGLGFRHSSSQVRESDLSTGIEITLSDIGAPTGGINLSVTAQGNDDNDISFATLVPISAGEKEKTLNVMIAQDGIAEDAERIRLTLSGQLPDPWKYTQKTHDLTILPNETGIAFETPSSRVAENAGTVELALVLDRPAPAGLVLALLSSTPADAAPASPVLRIPPGATRATFPVRITGDNIGEGSETVTISISENSTTPLPEGWRIGSPDAHELTLVDDDLFVGFERSSSQVRESDLSTDIGIMLSEIGAPDGGISLTVTAQGNEGNDISFATLVPVSAGEKEKTLSVAITQDNLPEGVERIVLALSGTLPESWQYGQTTHELTILPNEIDVAFETPSSRAAENAGTIELALVLDRPAPAGLVLALRSSAPADAAPTSPVLRVPAGATRVTFPVRITGDNIGEGSETVTIGVSESSTTPLPEGWRIGSPDEHELTLVDDDLFAGFERSSSQVRESDLTTDIGIILSEIGAPDGGISLTVTAQGNDDNDISFATLVPVSEGEKEKTLSVAITQDNLPEGAERIVLTLSGTLPESWQYGQTTHELTILPNENEIAFETPSTEVEEGEGTINVALRLNRPAPDGLVLAFDSSSPDDAVPASPSLRIPAGATRATLAVRITDDGIGELGETVTISILGSSPTSLPEGWNIGSRDTHDLIVTDDDLFAGFERSSSQVRESDLATELRIVLSEVGAPAEGMNLVVTAAGNDDNDISFTSPVQISAGEKGKTLSVAITQDNLPEDAERIVLTLSGVLPEPWQYGQTTHELTILPNEIDIAFETSSSRANENAGTVELALVLDRPAPAGLVLALRSSAPADAAPADPMLRVPAGATRVTFPVSITDDDIGEGSETVTISVSESSTTPLPEGWRIDSPDAHELTLADDDLFAGFEHPSSQVHESDLTTELRIVLSEIGAPTEGMSLAVTAAGNDDNDISFTSPVQISAGEKEKTLSVAITQDNLPEGAERIVLTLSGALPEPWQYGQTTHELTILPNGQTAMFAEAGRTVNEGDGTISFQVTLSEDAPAGGVPLEVAITSGNDDDDEDVTFTTQSFTITEGGRGHMISVVVVDDGLNESSEVVTFTLSKGGGFPEGWGGLGTQTSFDLTIEDNDQPDTPGLCEDGLYPDPRNKVNGPFRCTPIPPIPARCGVRFQYKGQVLPENLETWHRFDEIYDREGRYHITEEGYQDRFDDFTVGFDDTNCPALWINVVKTAKDGVTPLNPDDIRCRCGLPQDTRTAAGFKRIGGPTGHFFGTHSLRIIVWRDGTKYTDPLKEEVRERVRLNAIDRSGRILASLTWFINAN